MIHMMKFVKSFDHLAVCSSHYVCLCYGFFKIPTGVPTKRRGRIFFQSFVFIAPKTELVATRQLNFEISLSTVIEEIALIAIFCKKNLGVLLVCNFFIKDTAATDAGIFLNIG